MKKRLLVVAIFSVLLSACSLINREGAWTGARPAEPTPTTAPPATPTETLEQLEAEVDGTSKADLDADFAAIDSDLQAIEEELKSY